MKTIKELEDFLGERVDLDELLKIRGGLTPYDDDDQD